MRRKQELLRTNHSAFLKSTGGDAAGSDHRDPKQQQGPKVQKENLFIIGF